MSQQVQPEAGLTHEVRLRVPLPIVIPLGAFAVIALIAVGMSRILLSVPKEVSVIIAIAIATNILIAGAFIAQRPESARLSWPELAIVALYPLIVGIVIAQLGLGTGHSAGEAAHGDSAAAASEGGGTGTVGAANVQFDTDTIELKANAEAEIHFVNDDAVEHNIAIYQDDAAEQDIFVGEIIPGGEEITYTFQAPKKGEYYFQCDVHPAMNGTVTVQ